MAPVSGRHIARETFAVEHRALVQSVVGFVRAGFGKNMPRCRRIYLDVPKSSVAPKHWKGVLKDGEIFLLRHEGQVMNHEIRREICGRCEPGPIRLRGARQIKTAGREKIALQIKTALLHVERLGSEDCAKDK